MATVKEEFGFLPTSVWDIDKGSFWRQIIRDEGDLKPKRSKTAKYLPGLRFSEFNPMVAERIVRYWSEPGELIIDPFGGRSTRGVVSIVLGRNYQGYEVSRFAHEMLVSRLGRQGQQLLPGMDKGGRGDAILADGCLLEHSLDGSADLIFTCPPYWDLEKYESVPGQLSDCKTYKEFLDRLSEAVRNCRRVLRAGRFAVWVIADFRRDGLKLLHRDTIALFEEVGFETWDVIINKLRSPMTWAQIGKCAKQRYTSKEHEYILVFKKP